MPFAFLLSLQAAGMVVDWLGKRDQIKFAKMGQELEEAGINADIASSRLQAEDESLESMKQLRKNLGTQIAMSAARGIGAGSSNFILAPNESIGNFNADQRIRKINQLGREAALKANKTLSALHEKTYENNIWNDFRKDVFNQLPTSYAGSKAASFGLTKVGA